MKIVLDINCKQAKENDLIVFSKGKWIVVSRESFIAKYVNEQNNINDKMQKDIEKLKEDLVSLAKIVKEK